MRANVRMNVCLHACAYVMCVYVCLHVCCVNKYFYLSLKYVNNNVKNVCDILKFATKFIIK